MRLKAVSAAHTRQKIDLNTTIEGSLRTAPQRGPYRLRTLTHGMVLGRPGITCDFRWVKSIQVRLLTRVHLAQPLNLSLVMLSLSALVLEPEPFTSTGNFWLF